jgi:hypothetical protein
VATWCELIVESQGKKIVVVVLMTGLIFGDCLLELPLGRGKEGIFIVLVILRNMENMKRWLGHPVRAFDNVQHSTKLSYQTH